MSVGSAVDCPSDLQIIVAALRGELPLHDGARAAPEVAARIRAVVEADLARLELAAARNTDVDSALYYERTRDRLRRALALAAPAPAAGQDSEMAARARTGVVPGAGPGVKKRGASKAHARVGAADSARVRVQTQAAGAALLGVA